MKKYIYDIETLSNFFCVVFNDGTEEKVFEISDRRNNLNTLVEFYNPLTIQYAIGFNNLSFDSMVMQSIITDYKDLKHLSGSDVAATIYEYAQDSIKRKNNREFQRFPYCKIEVPQIDLYTINGYNNKNKMTSLKWLEFSMNMPKVQDMPYNHEDMLHPDNYDEVIDYCKNDVKATLEFAKRCSKLIKLRVQQNEQYEGLGLLNKSDPAFAEALFLKFLSESMNMEKKELKELRTYRTALAVKDLILPYISFKTEPFQRMLEFYQRAYSGGITYSLIHKGLKYNYGEGGLHASWENTVFEEDEEHMILDVDVKSFYPNLAIVNGFRPEHLGESFEEIYRSTYETRLKYPSGSPENASYKIILNGTYGKMGDEYSFLYDEKPKLEICINGQLLLSMLVERLSLMDDVTIIQANTDGVTIRLRRDDLDKVKELTSKWESLTKLTLEFSQYKKMAISNVNNYIAVYTDGKVKLKGQYEIDPDLHKNRSQRIVPIALYRFFVYGIDIAETIYGHMDRTEPYEDDIENCGIYDFCIGKKVKWNQNFVIRTNQGEQKITEKVIRYYICKKTGNMFKIYNDGREEAVNKGYNTILFQNYEDKDDYDINYRYYEREAYKITSPFFDGNPSDGYQTSLF